ncbi:hypothetical protein [Aureimonas sp. AU40]|uniref:hypothetical protein n=1 Tax=Aureimonas sp. AU40 TaxID=1637747 RepID=UPI000A43A1EB|nr:hypothetical protein [Aureimonas sp. AU40]
MSGLESDILATKHIRKEFIAMEGSLFTRKWFSYRQLVPAEATMEYVAAYFRQFRITFARNIDKRTSTFIKPKFLKEGYESVEEFAEAFEDPSAKKKLVSCWRGRQVADALGMPYDVYIDLVMGFRLRYWTHSYLPQPQHLFGPEDVEKTAERWEEMQKGRIYVCDEPAYHNENYVGAAYQNDHHEWLFKQAFMRQNPVAYLTDFVGQNLIPMEKVAARLSARDRQALNDNVSIPNA